MHIASLLTQCVNYTCGLQKSNLLHACHMYCAPLKSAYNMLLKKLALDQTLKDKYTSRRRRNVRHIKIKRYFALCCGKDACSAAQRAAMHWHTFYACNASRTVQYIILRVIVVVHARVLHIVQFKENSN